MGTALVLITLVGSMLLTNDTALLTFLPLSWMVLQEAGQEKLTAYVFILQNCAANLGGMLTPFGNPQNLYLFDHYHIPVGQFLSIMLLPFALSTGLILLCCLLIPRQVLTVPQRELTLDKPRAIAYGLLFCLAVGMVLRAVPYPVGLAVIAAALARYGPSGAEKRRLGAAGDLCRVFRVLRQHGPDPAGAGAVRSTAGPWRPAGIGADVPGDQQRTCRLLLSQFTTAFGSC